MAAGSEGDSKLANVRQPMGTPLLANRSNTEGHQRCPVGTSLRVLFTERVSHRLRCRRGWPRQANVRNSKSAPRTFPGSTRSTPR